MLEQFASLAIKMGWSGWAIVLIILSCFIDLTPGIKWNPIKSLFRYLGKSFNHSVESEINGFKTEVNKEFDNMDSKFDELQKEQLAQRDTLNQIISDQEEKELSSLRWAIINFENSIDNNEKHTRDQYRHILHCGEKYMRIINKYKESEHKSINTTAMDESLKKIQDRYDESKYDQSKLLF